MKQDWQLIWKLAQRFPDNLIHEPAPGKYGRYIKHSDVTQRMLSIVGLHDFSVDVPVRGVAPAIKTANNEWPARDNAIVGVIASMTITDSSGEHHTVTEVGTEDNPAMGTDAENLKNATSDAYKRCSMRFGLGLHMWSPESYFLDTLVKDGGAPAEELGETVDE